MSKIDRVIDHFRNLREMMAVGTSGFTSSSDSEGPVAGYDKPMKKYAKGGRGSRKKWLEYLKTK
jgi:hypothetical protein